MWRDIPGEFFPWQTVYWYYCKWVKDGTWENINRFLVAENRISNDKNFQPTVAIIDSQSAKNSSTCTDEVEIDGGKLVKGRKRFYLTDTLGNLLDSFVVSASSYDGTAVFQFGIQCDIITLYNSYF